MSRVNKYRGLHNDEWVYGYYAVIGMRDVIIKIKSENFYSVDENLGKRNGNEIVDVKSYTVGQYIGVEDKNGKKIYDGDIVKIHQFLFDGCEYEKEIVVSIEYMQEMACFGANLLQARDIREYMGYDNETDKQEKAIVPLCNFYGLHEESFEVIGNVYENSDLLKEVER